MEGSMIIIDVCMIIIATAFVILVIYLAVTMSKVNHILKQVDQTLIEGRKQVAELMIDVTKIIRHSDQISIDIDEKINAFTPLFKTIKDLGEILQCKSASLKNSMTEKIKHIISFTNLKNQYSGDEDELLTRDGKVKYVARVLKDVLEITAIGMHLWQNIKKRR
jgi:uncharacterized protein YoxC